MPSLSINNDHGKSFTGSLVGMEPIGAPTFGASSVNGVYHLSLSFGLTIPDMSILSSNTPGQSSGIILSGTVKNKTAKTKETLIQIVETWMSDNSDIEGAIELGQAALDYLNSL